MRRIRLIIQYDGTDYAGFQVQPDRPTVQRALEEALGRLLCEAVRVQGASRTDAGVHAAGQVVAFTTENPIPVERVVLALNALLPPDVAAVAADEVPADFHPQYSARRKQYVYRVLNRPLPSPFLGRHAWHVAPPLDVAAMQRAARPLVGEHDFAAFRAAGGAAKTTVRELFDLTVCTQDETIEFTLCGNGFLYMMVRNVVGTLVEVGLGRVPAERVAVVLASRSRSMAGPTAPPHGLTLVRIDY
jgi:tRNA pseudouridine38-40 synthase